MNRPEEIGGKLAAWLRTLWCDEKRRINLLLVAGLAGMLLLAFSEWLPVPKSKAALQKSEQLQSKTTLQQEANDWEQRLQELIAQVDGAGRTAVMVTFACGEETVYATDYERAQDSEKTQHILLNDGSALQETVLTPQLLGVAVLCEGGADPSVQSRVTELVSALTDLGSNHITVAKLTATS